MLECLRGWQEGKRANLFSFSKRFLSRFFIGFYSRRVILSSRTDCIIVYQPCYGRLQRRRSCSADALLVRTFTPFLPKILHLVLKKIESSKCRFHQLSFF